VTRTATRPSRAPWLAALATPLVLVFALPIVALVGRAVASGRVLDAALQPAVIDALTLSLVTTGASIALTVVAGTPLAVLLARRRGRGLSLLEALVDLPIVLPPSVAGLALLLLLGRSGPLGAPLEAAGIALPFTTVAVVVAQTFVSAPFYVRAARAGFVGVDRDLEDAARVDGAGERGVFRHIAVPLAAPALAAGIVVAWARALGEFGATIMFAGNIRGATQTLPLLVYSEFQSSLDASVAAAAILVAAAGGILVAARLVRWRPGLETL
jgi:molybdate transport system permease protein